MPDRSSHETSGSAENERLRAEVARLEAELKSRDAELAQFAHVTSHDLKAPLRGIAKLAEWLEEDLGDTLVGESRRHVELLRRRVQRMDSLLDGILAYSRAGRSSEQPEPLDVRELVRQVATRVGVAPPASIEGVDELPSVVGERAALEQVFACLISNALRHAKRSDVVVRVSHRQADGAHHFAVSDNGQGIAPDFHARVWEVFQTLAPKDEVEGSGLGLSLVKKAVEARGGRVGLESAKGEGATFHFSWPLLPER
jgi:light-regulated signal transduction histidine kinase (bacteriophytochrome)